MITEAEKCEACRRNVVEVFVEDDDPIQPYRVCAVCARRLQQLALRPLEWFNLAAVHGPAKHSLHDDFYYDNGIACQSDEDVEEPQRYPAPTLEEVSRDRERLLDYAMTLYYLDAPTVAALGEHDKGALLASLQQRVAAYPNDTIEVCALEICANVLGPVAADWIRERWAEWNLTTFLALAEATAACLPLDEGFARVAQVFEDAALLSRLQQSRLGVGGNCHTFAPFHSPRTLDWMEAHSALVTHENWGRVAAQSHFSWPRAVRWLEQGRPFSHIALFAIQACYRYDTVPLRKQQPVLEEAASVKEMQQRLEAYYAVDHVPRVRNLVQNIGSLMAKASENRGQ